MVSSFSSGVKSEICRTVPLKSCCAAAECYGILLFCNRFSSDGIRINTECLEFAQLLPKLFDKAFNIQFDSSPEECAKSKLSFQISDSDKLAVIFNAFGFNAQSTLSVHLNLAAVEEECCKASFLRGAFLAGGSVTDPVKGYHLEISTGHQCVARECYSLIQDTLSFAPKCTERCGNQVLYMKQSDAISDFLTYLGAPVAAMGIMETKLEKELNNMINRRCNCDDANISKVVDAAQEQLAAIRRLRQNGRFEGLPVKLRQAATAREQNPLLSLTDLAALMEPPISKPAMNHRLKKLVAMAGEAEE